MPEKNRWPFSIPLEFLHKVKYGGAVGKLTAIAVAAVVVCGIAMVCGWGNQTVILTAIGAVLVVVFGAFFEIRQTLEKHPELALLDGTELVA